MSRGEGRGRLGKMDMLPREAATLLQKLHEDIIERRASQEHLREKFNSDIAGLGVDPISRGTFSRYVMKVYHQHQKVMGAG